MFDQYIDRYGKRLFGLCLKLCTHRENAEDLYQETWIRAYKSFGQYDATRAFEGWLTAICVNAYRDMRRRQRWQSRLMAFTPAQKDLLAQIPAASAPDYTDIRDAVNALPEKYRLVVVLHYFQDLDVNRTAEALHMPAGTVKYRLHRARELLKRRLEQDG